ncbi:MAG: hypothetical protein KDA42_19900, partial [Planctomycetales bacterium]|nr:hypothetical protein [Planctomycetales bacterium]
DSTDMPAGASPPPHAGPWSIAKLLAATATVAMVGAIFLQLHPIMTFQNCGLFGFLVVSSGLLLTAAGVVLIYTARQPATFLFYGSLGLLPILAGLAGTLLGIKLAENGFDQVARSTTDPAVLAIARQQLEAGYVVGWMPAQHGLAFGLATIVTAALGFLIVRRRSRAG